jgi:hypothetical protein
MKFRFIILFLLFSYTVIFPQIYPALPFLLNQQSPIFYGAGEIGTAVPMQDPVGFYYNPAQLGYYSQNNNVSIFFMPDKTVLFNNDPNKVTSYSYGAAAGYNFKSNGSSTPLSIGIGYLHNRYDYVGEISPKVAPDSYDCISVGAGFENYLIYNIGFSVKSYISKLSYNPVYDFTGSGVMFDFGAMIIIPFDNIYLNNTLISMGNTEFKPILKISTGYSILNIGKVVYYNDLESADPLPRTARLGYNLNLGFKTNIAGAELPIIDYSFTAEVDNQLYNGYTNGKLIYKGLLGDIDIIDNLLLLNGRYNVTVHKGHIFNFLKTLTIVTGSIVQENYSNFTSSGWAVSTEGLFQVLEKNTSGASLNYLFKHFYLEYYSVNGPIGYNRNPKQHGISLYFKELTL